MTSSLLNLDDMNNATNGYDTLDMERYIEAVSSFISPYGLILYDMIQSRLNYSNPRTSSTRA